MSASYCSCIFRFPICYMYYVIYINDWRCHLLLASLPFCCFNMDYARLQGIIAPILVINIYKEADWSSL